MTNAGSSLNRTLSSMLGSYRIGASAGMPQMRGVQIWERVTSKTGRNCRNQAIALKTPSPPPLVESPMRFPSSQCLRHLGHLSGREHAASVSYRTLGDQYGTALFLRFASAACDRPKEVLWVVTLSQNFTVHFATKWSI